jgi:hypothetical protein
MRSILAVLTLIIAQLSQAAVVGAGDLRWELFYEDSGRTMKYSLDSVTMMGKQYSPKAEVLFYTKFKQPYSSRETDYIEIKYVFQQVIFDCLNRTYKQTDFRVFDWADEYEVAHLVTSNIYAITGGSPMDKLRGIVCYTKKM